MSSGPTMPTSCIKVLSSSGAEQRGRWCCWEEEEEQERVARRGHRAGCRPAGLIAAVVLSP